jgi:hypothetical protein
VADGQTVAIVIAAFERFEITLLSTQFGGNSKKLQV